MAAARYGRVTRGSAPEHFTHLSQDPRKRLSWVFDDETLQQLLSKSHLDILLQCGHTPEWIRYQLNAKKQFKLIVFRASASEVKLATWDNLFELLARVYPEIDSSIWHRHADDLKRLTFAEIDPEQTIVKNYYQGAQSDVYMHTERFLSLPAPISLWQARAFLHNQIGLNELFGGNGMAITHLGDVSCQEYLTVNRRLDELSECALLDLNPILA